MIDPIEYVDLYYKIDHPVQIPSISESDRIRGTLVCLRDLRTMAHIGCGKPQRTDRNWKDDFAVRQMYEDMMAAHDDKAWKKAVNAEFRRRLEVARDYEIGLLVQRVLKRESL